MKDINHELYISEETLNWWKARIIQEPEVSGPHEYTLISDYFSHHPCRSQRDWTNPDLEPLEKRKSNVAILLDHRIVKDNTKIQEFYNVLSSDGSHSSED